MEKSPARKQMEKGLLQYRIKVLNDNKQFEEAKEVEKILSQIN